MSDVLSSPPPMPFPHASRPIMDRASSYRSPRSGTHPLPGSSYSYDSNNSAAALPRIPRSSPRSRIHNFGAPSASPPPPPSADLAPSSSSPKPAFSLNGSVFSPSQDEQLAIKTGSNTLPRARKVRAQQPIFFRMGQDDDDASDDSAREPKSAPIPAPKPTINHQAYVPGKGNALRLNLESLRRSASEIRVPQVATSAIERPCTTYLRKKSGELVKPSLKNYNNLTISTSGVKSSKSAPATPTAKNVHFDTQLEHVKLFLAEQKPLAVSRDGSPTETSEGEEFPFPYASSDDEKIRKALCVKVVGLPSTLADDSCVKLESLTLADDARSLNGIICVRNLAYNKWIAARFTLDSWQTTSEVMARHLENIHGGQYDRFIFNIKLVDVLPRIVEKTMELAIRYSIEGSEMWDNNHGRNYQVHFSKNQVQPPAPTPPPAPAKKADVKIVATSPTATSDPIATLKRELQKVLPDDSESDSAASILARVGKRSGGAISAPTAPVARDRLLPVAIAQLTPETPSPEPSPPPSPLKSPISLAQRYDFSASLKSAWTPPSVPFPTKQPRKNTMSAFAAPRSPPDLPKLPIDTSVPRTLPRGSPRDRDAESDSEVGPDGYVRKPWGSNSGGRNHRRTSYFDSWVTSTPDVRRTPPGTPKQATSPTSSNETVTPRPEKKDAGISGDHSSPEHRATVPVSFAWGFPHSPNWSSTSESTPSVTSSSGSPSSPPSGLSDVNATLVENKVDHFNYRSFVNQFCFYTGNNMSPRLAAEHDFERSTLDPRRTLSASSVENYFLHHSSRQHSMEDLGVYGSGDTTPTNKTTLGSAASAALGDLSA